MNWYAEQVRLGDDNEKGSKKRATKKPAARREQISPRGDKRYIRRDAKGRIKESDDVGCSLPQDRCRKAKAKAVSGQGDRDDRKHAKAKAGKRRVPADSPKLDLFGEDLRPEGWHWRRPKWIEKRRV